MSRKPPVFVAAAPILRCKINLSFTPFQQTTDRRHSPFRRVVRVSGGADEHRARASRRRAAASHRPPRPRCRHVEGAAAAKDLRRADGLGRAGDDRWLHDCEHPAVRRSGRTAGAQHVPRAAPRLRRCGDQQPRLWDGRADQQQARHLPRADVAAVRGVGDDLHRLLPACRAGFLAHRLRHRHDRERHADRHGAAGARSYGKPRLRRLAAERSGDPRR